MESIICPSLLSHLDLLNIVLSLDLQVAYSHKPSTSRPIDQRSFFCSSPLPNIHLS